MLLALLQPLLPLLLQLFPLLLLILLSRCLRLLPRCMPSPATPCMPEAATRNVSALKAPFALRSAP